jgi:hypothetical protein
MSPLTDGEEKAKEVALVAESLVEYPMYFVETGTNYGHTLKAVSDLGDFKHLFSMENYHPAYLNCLQSLWDYPTITLIYADSGVHLPRLLDEVKYQCFLWLDAHGAEPDSASPLADELNVLFGRAKDRHVILIDDYRCFAEYDKWPPTEWIEKRALQTGYNYSVENDIIRLIPQN